MLLSINDTFTMRYDAWAKDSDASTRDIDDANLTPRHIADLAAAYSNYPQCAKGLYKRLASWAEGHIDSFGQNSLAMMLAGFANASATPSPTLVGLCDKRIADLKTRPRAGFQPDQQEKLDLWERFKAKNKLVGLRPSDVANDVRESFGVLGVAEEEPRRRSLGAGTDSEDYQRFMMG